MPTTPTTSSTLLVFTPRNLPQYDDLSGACLLQVARKEPAPDSNTDGRPVTRHPTKRASEVQQAPSPAEKSKPSKRDRVDEAIQEEGSVVSVEETGTDDVPQGFSRPQTAKQQVGRPRIVLPPPLSPDVERIETILETSGTLFPPPTSSISCSM